MNIYDSYYDYDINTNVNVVNVVNVSYDVYFYNYHFNDFYVIVYSFVNIQMRLLFVRFIYYLYLYSYFVRFVLDLVFESIIDIFLIIIIFWINYIFERINI